MGGGKGAVAAGFGDGRREGEGAGGWEEAGASEGVLLASDVGNLWDYSTPGLQVAHVHTGNVQSVDLYTALPRLQDPEQNQLERTLPCACLCPNPYPLTGPNSKRTTLQHRRQVLCVTHHYFFSTSTRPLGGHGAGALVSALSSVFSFVYSPTLSAAFISSSVF